MKKIALLVHRFGPYHIARLKAASQYNKIIGVEMCSVDTINAWENDLTTIDDIKIITVFKNENIFNKSPKVIKKRVFRTLNDLNLDVIAITGCWERGRLAGLKYAIENKIPAIILSDSSEHDHKRYFIKELIKKKIVRLFSSGLVAGSSSEAYLEKLGINCKYISRGLAAVDNEKFQREKQVLKNSEIKNDYFLTVCRFIPKKNLDNLIIAFNSYLKMETKNKKWDLVVVGDGPLKRELIKLAKSLHLSERIHFPGYLHNERLIGYYSNANAFILPSKIEQWGLVVNEAMSSSLPVLISNRCGCCKDLVEEGFNGYSFDPYDCDELSSKMKYLSEMKAHNLKEMGENSLKIISKCSLKNFADGLNNAANLALKYGSVKNNYIGKLFLELLIYKSNLDAPFN